MNRPLAYLAIAGGVGVTLFLGAVFGPIGLLTGIVLMFIMKPVIEDLW